MKIYEKGKPAEDGLSVQPHNKFLDLEAGSGDVLPVPDFKTKPVRTGFFVGDSNMCDREKQSALNKFL